MSSTSSAEESANNQVSYYVNDSELYRLLLLKERAEHAKTRADLARAQLSLAAQAVEVAESEARECAGDLAMFFRSEFATDVDRTVFAFPESFEVSESSRTILLTRKS